MFDAADSHETLTFVVRLWRETDANGHGDWRGRVEHVGTQEVGYVEDAAGVAHYLERWIRPQGLGARAALGESDPQTEGSRGLERSEGKR